MRVNDQWVIGFNILPSSYANLQWPEDSFVSNVTNTTSGTYVVPTLWHEVWSFQINTRYAVNKTYALLDSITYDTNPVPLATNSIGYPIAAAGALSSGLDISLTNTCFIQGMYTYEALLPDSPINNSVSQGVAHSHVHAGTVQITYKK